MSRWNPGPVQWTPKELHTEQEREDSSSLRADVPAGAGKEREARTCLSEPRVLGDISWLLDGKGLGKVKVTQT